MLIGGKVGWDDSKLLGCYGNEMIFIWIEVQKIDRKYF